MVGKWIWSMLAVLGDHVKDPHQDEKGHPTARTRTIFLSQHNPFFLSFVKFSVSAGIQTLQTDGSW